MKILKPITLAFLLPLSLTAVKANPTSMHKEARELLVQDTLAWSAKLPFDNE